jgi:hypothetical protein
MMQEGLNAGNFDDLTGYAHRSALIHLDNVESWFYLTDGNIQLERLAFAVFTGDAEFIKDLVINGQLLITKTVRDIPGDDFLCIDLQDAYLLKPFKL